MAGMLGTMAAIDTAEMIHHHRRHEDIVVVGRILTDVRARTTFSPREKMKLWIHSLIKIIMLTPKSRVTNTFKHSNIFDGGNQEGANLTPRA